MAALLTSKKMLYNATLPLAAIRGVQIAAVLLGLSVALTIAWRAAHTHAHSRGQALGAALPWMLLLMLLAAAALYIFLLPMEMRGNVLG